MATAGERTGRLRKGREFDTVYREGSVTGGRLLVVRHAENGLGVSRWGFAVGKRIAKKAAVRNRVRRRLRECGRLLTVRGGVDLIVSARGGAVEASFQELREELERALGRARLLEAAPAA